MPILILVLTVILIASLLFLIPIAISVNILYCKELNKLFIAIYLFKFIKLFSAYVQFEHFGIVLHSKRKARIYNVKTTANMSNKIRVFKDFSVIDLKSNIDVGGKKELISVSVISYVISYITEIVSNVFTTIKPQIKFNNTINIYEDADGLNAYLYISIIFNILTIILTVFKTLWGRIFYGKRKQQT